jgi:hypothetical protein
VGASESRVGKRKTGLLFLYKVSEHYLSLTYSFQLRAEGHAEVEASRHMKAEYDLLRAQLTAAERRVHRHP